MERWSARKAKNRSENKHTWIHPVHFKEAENSEQQEEVPPPQPPHFVPVEASYVIKEGLVMDSK
jgi:hypothetical protein